LRMQDDIQQSIALAQLLIAPLSPEQALGQALIAGLRLLPAAREVTVYAAPQPGCPGGLLRLAAVTRRVAADEGELDLAPSRRTPSASAAPSSGTCSEMGGWLTRRVRPACRCVLPPLWRSACSVCLSCGGMARGWPGRIHGWRDGDSTCS